jgi:two-component system, NtrC family, sensor kinase
VRLGIRLQILLALSALLALAFVPLDIAVSKLTRATLRAMNDHAALSVARTVARELGHAQARLGTDDLRSLTQAETATGNTIAVGFYDPSGRAVLRLGRTGEGDLPRTVPVGTEQLTNVATPVGPAVQVVVPTTSGAVAVLLRREDDGGRATPLLRLVGLYGAVVALALLLVAYASLTRLIVRPLDALSAAARRVAAGARKLDVNVPGPSEIADLSASLAEMTAKLKADEQHMIQQIDELEHGAEKLREAQDRLIRSERLASVGRLAAGLAHEIGNPIAALMGLEDLLLTGDLSSEEQRDFLVRIRSETERIHRVLRDLLEFARPASAPTTAAKDEPGSVSDAIADVVALVRPQRAFREVELRVDASFDLPRVVLGRERIMQVLLNLLLNATDAVGPHGQITVRAERHDGDVVIVVEDDGPGIDQAILPRLFEPFVSTKEVGKGTGLGLAVCRGIVESVDGSIRLEEGRARGTAFVVSLPVA